MSVVFRLKINHERDVHCVFILGLLVRIQTPDTLRSITGTAYAVTINIPVINMANTAASLLFKD